MDHIRYFIDKQAPLGEKSWKVNIAKRYGLESTLNSVGRARRNSEV